MESYCTSALGQDSLVREEDVVLDRSWNLYVVRAGPPAFGTYPQTHQKGQDFKGVTPRVASRSPVLATPPIRVHQTGDSLAGEIARHRGGNLKYRVYTPRDGFLQRHRRSGDAAHRRCR